MLLGIYPCALEWWLLTAVVLLVVVQTELLAVVGAAHQISSAAPVAVIVTAISRTVTVTLTLVTGGLRSAASPALEIAARTSLT